MRLSHPRFLTDIKASNRVMETLEQNKIASLLKSGVLTIETDKPRHETDQFCKDLEPWRVVVEFDNGTKTTDFARRDFMFNRFPLGKMRIFNQFINLEAFKNKSILDIGFNEGYHSIFFAKYLNCQVDAIDVLGSALTRAKKISEFLDLDINYSIDNAITYRRDEKYDLILHLGTLYHLTDVSTAIKNAAASLKQDGHLFLETITYEGGSEYDCQFLAGINNDSSNIWALSVPTLDYMFKECGLSRMAHCKDIEVELLKGTGMKRGLLIYKKDL